MTAVYPPIAPSTFDLIHKELEIQGYLPTHTIAMESLQRALIREESNYPDIRIRILDEKVILFVTYAVYLTISEYRMNRYDPVFDPEEMAIDAKNAIKLLKKAKRSVDLLPSGSRRWLSEVQLAPLPEILAEAIEILEEKSKRPIGVRRNVGLYEAIKKAILTVEAFVGRPFRKNFDVGEDGVFNCADARVVQTLMQSIDPNLTQASIRAVLQKIALQNSRRRVF